MKNMLKGVLVKAENFEEFEIISSVLEEKSLFVFEKDGEEIGKIKTVFKENACVGIYINNTDKSVLWFKLPKNFKLEDVIAKFPDKFPESLIAEVPQLSAIFWG